PARPDESVLCEDREIRHNLTARLLPQVLLRAVPGRLRNRRRQERHAGAFRFPVIASICPVNRSVCPRSRATSGCNGPPPSSSATGVLSSAVGGPGEDEDAEPSMRCADIGRSNARPLRIEPEVGQVSEY